MCNFVMINFFRLHWPVLDTGDLPNTNTLHNLSVHTKSNPRIVTVCNSFTSKSSKWFPTQRKLAMADCHGHTCSIGVQCRFTGSSTKLASWGLHIFRWKWRTDRIWVYQRKFRCHNNCWNNQGCLLQRGHYNPTSRIFKEVSRCWIRFDYIFLHRFTR